MQVQSWNNELPIAQNQFRRIFNNIEIISGGKKIKFNCILGNRSRIFKNLENPNKDATLKLPLIIITRTGLTKNNDRLANLNNEVKYAQSAKKRNYNLYTPVPIDINYQVSIVSKYQEYNDRVIQNFIPFFNKDLYVTCEHPKFEGIVYTNQIIMDDGISEEHPEDVAPTADDLVVTTCNFTFKTYLFCGTDKAQLKHSTHKVLSSVVEKKFATVISDDKTMKDIIDSLSTTIGKGQVFKITQEIKLDTDSDIEKVKDLVGSLSSIDTPISVDYPKTEDKWVDVEDDGPGEISGFIPTVKRLYVGFYPVSLLSSHTEYMNYADSKSDNIVKLYGESYLSSDGEKEIVVDQYTTSAEYYPYVDKFIWNFD